MSKEKKNYETEKINGFTNWQPWRPTASTTMMDSIIKTRSHVRVHADDKNISGCVSLVTQFLTQQFEYCYAILVTVFSHPEEDH